MITFLASKEKKIEMMIETKGIKPQSLNFTFRIMIEGIEYGFPCTLIGDAVTVTIPPLFDVISENIKEGEYNAKLEVTGDSKYYLKPFDDKVRLKIDPKVEITMSETNEDVEEVVEQVKMSISSLVDEDVEEVKPIPVVKQEPITPTVVKEAIIVPEIPVVIKKKSKFVSAL